MIIFEAATAATTGACDAATTTWAGTDHAMCPRPIFSGRNRPSSVVAG